VHAHHFAHHEPGIDGAPLALVQGPPNFPRGSITRVVGPLSLLGVGSFPGRVMAGARAGALEDNALSKVHHVCSQARSLVHQHR
jgi:hypothetical protein